MIKQIESKSLSSEPTNVPTILTRSRAKATDANLVSQPVTQTRGTKRNRN